MVMRAAALAVALALGSVSAAPAGAASARTALEPPRQHSSEPPAALVPSQAAIGALSAANASSRAIRWLHIPKTGSGFVIPVYRYACPAVPFEALVEAVNNDTGCGFP